MCAGNTHAVPSIQLTAKRHWTHAKLDVHLPKSPSFFTNTNAGISMIRKLGLLIGVLFVSVVSCATVNMKTNGDCGEIRILNKDEILTLDSDGSIPNGNCTIEIKPDSQLQTACAYYPICFQPNDILELDRQCYAKLQLTALLMNKKKVSWSIGCGMKTYYDPRCYDATSLRVELLEGEKYEKYSFRGSVFAKCQNSPTDVVEYETDMMPHKYASSDGSLPGHDDIEFKSLAAEVHADRIVGIIVAVCLASIFLVVMIICYFYYKNKAYTSVPKA